jgi:hypothetical protein
MLKQIGTGLCVIVFLLMLLFGFVTHPKSASMLIAVGQMRTVVPIYHLAGLGEGLAEERLGFNIS